MSNTSSTGDIFSDPTVIKISHKSSLKLSQLQYFTYMIIGISLLWPWNCLLSASAYYGHRFSQSPGLTRVYSSTMMTVSTVSSTIFNYYLSQAQTGVSYNRRINLGLSITVGLFIIMAFSCILDFFIKMSDAFFFFILMSIVLFASLATCLAQNGTMAKVNVLGGIYANGVMVGQAIAGVLPSIALIASILIVGDTHGKSASENYYVEKNYGVFIYYITASLISAISIVLLSWVNSFKNNSSYQALDQIMEDNTIINEESEDHVLTQNMHVPFKLLWSKLKLIGSTIFLTFSITLIFPVFASSIESTHKNSTHVFFHKSIYIPFIYLIWNLGDLVGRILCGVKNSVMLIKNPRTLIIYSIFRLIFIPLFLTCNINRSHEIDSANALINSDMWYIILQLLFGLSNGQLATSCFMIVGDHCDTDDEREAAGGFTSVILSIGLASGSIFSYLLILIIN